MTSTRVDALVSRIDELEEWLGEVADDMIERTEEVT